MGNEESDGAAVPERAMPVSPDRSRLFQGPTSCLEKPGETVAAAAALVRGAFVTRGVLRNCIEPAVSKPIILGCPEARASSARTWRTRRSPPPSRKSCGSIADGRRGLPSSLGSDYEKESLMNLADLVNDCEDFGIPVMAVTAVGKELEQREARYWR